MLAGIGLQAHAFACATCQRIRSSIFAAHGMGFFLCHRALIGMSFLGKPRCPAARRAGRRSASAVLRSPHWPRR